MPRSHGSAENIVRRSDPTLGSRKTQMLAVPLRDPVISVVMSLVEDEPRSRSKLVLIGWKRSYCAAL